MAKPRASFARRAALRRRAIAEQETPETHGPESKASLLMLGVPEGEVAGAAAKTAAKFGPKGFKAAKNVAESTGQYAMRVLKPILSKGMKAAKKVK
jgi:hypothetical protein